MCCYTMMYNGGNKENTLIDELAEQLSENVEKTM